MYSELVLSSRPAAAQGQNHEGPDAKGKGQGRRQAGKPDSGSNDKIIQGEFVMNKEKISAWVDAHKDEMLEDICELCRVNSEKMPAEEDMPFGPGTAECLDMALDMAEGYGFETCDYDGYVGCVDMNELPHQLDILAHLDVVPAGEGWTVTEPFKPVLKDGKLYGRGTADDKGPAVAALYAMRAVKELGIPLKKNVRLILGTDEECGSSDIRPLLQH